MNDVFVILSPNMRALQKSVPSASADGIKNQVETIFSCALIHLLTQMVLTSASVG